MAGDKIYDVIITGGGLAGLSASTLLARQGFDVLVLEKEHYPRHKVCGEYVSRESLPFLEELGIQPAALELPEISELMVTDPFGNEVKDRLPRGGIGISRYLLDATLAGAAVNAGVKLMQGTRADDVTFAEDLFTVQAGGVAYRGKVVCGAWGKRSNMDVRWNRAFIRKQRHSLNNYIGVKYHVRYPWPEKVIGLHNFEGGYCGISKVEGDRYCLCYLAKAADLKKNNNDVHALEKNVLGRNPWLERIFREAVFENEVPVTISQISFERKERISGHVLMLGDAAGMITPLCGNGMSMALHSGKLAAQIVVRFLHGGISRKQMEQGYDQAWKHLFSRRISFGIWVQRYFGRERATALFLQLMRRLPWLRKRIVQAVTGKPY